MTSVRPGGLLNSDDCVSSLQPSSRLWQTLAAAPRGGCFIIDRALAGERDPRTLKQEALRLLGITHS
jgi:hypothetical protein